MDPTSNPMGLGAILATSAGAMAGPHMDAMARAHGFANAQQMADFYAQQSRRTGQNGTGDNSGGMTGIAAQAINHPSQAVNQGSSWRPSTLFDYILGKINAAIP